MCEFGNALGIGPKLISFQSFNFAPEQRLIMRLYLAGVCTISFFVLHTLRYTGLASACSYETRTTSLRVSGSDVLEITSLLLQVTVFTRLMHRLMLEGTNQSSCIVYPCSGQLQCMYSSGKPYSSDKATPIHTVMTCPTTLPPVYKQQPAN